jgi:GT2 family glycosyltransferase
MWRLNNLGFKIRYNKNAVILHDWGNIKQEIRRAYNYGKERVRLYRKHPEMLSNLLGYDLYTLIFSLYILLLPITVIFPYYLLFLVITFLRNLFTSSIRKVALQKVFLDLIYGFGVITGLLKVLVLRT